MSDNQLTKEEFIQALPACVKKSVNDDVINDLNLMIQNPDTVDFFRENLLSWSKVMEEGKFKLTSYINAVKYVSYTMLNCTSKEAYIKTFPDRYTDWVSRGVSDKTISKYVTAYKQSKLVTLITKQTLVPLWILNQSYAQEAVNSLVNVMRTSNSDRNIIEASKAILEHLKQPEETKISLDIGIKTNEVIEQQEQMLRELAKKQQELIESGVNISSVINLKSANPKKEAIPIAAQNQEN